MTKQKINLPRVYEIKKDTPKKFHKYKGRPKLSYSQYTSYNDPQYSDGYILGYIFGIDQPSGFWATFGSYVGDTLAVRLDIENAKDEKERQVIEDAYKYFNETDIETLKKANAMFPENAVYEREVILDCGEYITQGFIDVNFKKDGKEVVIDNKTGGKGSKTKGPQFYSSDKYGQTRLYAKALKEEGCELGYCGVLFLDRTYETERTHPGTTSCFENPILHLSGELINIETPYSEEKVEHLIKDMTRTVNEISELKTTYDSLSQLTIEY